MIRAAVAACILVATRVSGASVARAAQHRRRGGGGGGGASSAARAAAAGLPLAATCAAGLCAVTELRETFMEVGHHHGLALLSLSHLAKALVVLDEVGEKTLAEAARPERRRRACARWQRRLLRVLSSQITRKILCAGALLAAAAEVKKDVAPGGHHGTFLLSFQELTDLFAHLFDGTPALGAFLSSTALNVSIAAGALACALVELVSDLRPGAHHGVVILALSSALKSANALFDNRRKISKVARQRNPVHVI